MIVIDIGCFDYGRYHSIEPLLEQFKPEFFFGFDPHPGTADMSVDTSVSPDTALVIRQEAAWTFDGEVNFHASRLGSAVVEWGEIRVVCFDLARFIDELGEQKIVLKIDAEGAEYELLDHLIAKDMDKRLDLAWVEWHFDERAAERRHLEKEIRCELWEWNL